MSAIIPVMDWSADDLAESFSLHKQKFSSLVDEEITDEKAKSRKLQRGIGDEGMKHLNASGLAAADLEKTAALFKFFEGQLKVSINFHTHCLYLMQFWQNSKESLGDFITVTRTLALKC